MEHEDGGDTSCDWCTWNNPLRIGKETERLGNQKTSCDHPALLRSARILNRVLETWGDLLSLKLQKKTSANAGVKNSPKSK